MLLKVVKRLTKYENKHGETVDLFVSVEKLFDICRKWMDNIQWNDVFERDF